MRKIKIIGSLFLVLFLLESTQLFCCRSFLSYDTIPGRQAGVLTTIPLDTLQWKDVTEKFPPISEDRATDFDAKQGAPFKSKYNLQLLIPFGATSLTDPATSRFVHFYAGILMALELLEKEGVSLSIRVTDLGEKKGVLKDEIREIFASEPDVIVGPLERDDIKLLMDTCMERKVTLISPWYSFAKLPNENPYYMQIKPNLRSHFSKIVDETTRDYRKGEVVIVGRKNKDTQAWIQFFQEKANEITGEKNYFDIYFANPDSISKGPTAFFKLFSNPEVKAIILPNYSFSDENWLYDVVRRLAAEKPSLPITVYGMPILYESELIDIDLLSALRMSIVTAEFVDDYDEKVRSFKRQFLELYGEIPKADAVRGYDLMVFIGRNLLKYGNNFQSFIEDVPYYGLQTTLLFKKPDFIKKSDDSIDENQAFYDNSFLELIRFENNRWNRQ